MDKKWEDCGRDDLNMIPRMRKLGFVAEFKWQDRNFGRTMPDNPPHEVVVFYEPKKMTYVWPTIDFHSHERVWRVAELDNDSYVNHRSYGSLEEFVAKEVNK